MGCGEADDIVSGRSHGRQRAVLMSATGQLRGRLRAVSRVRCHTCQTRCTSLPTARHSRPNLISGRWNGSRAALGSAMVTSEKSCSSCALWLCRSSRDCLKLIQLPKCSRTCTMVVHGLRPTDSLIKRNGSPPCGRTWVGTGTSPVRLVGCATTCEMSPRPEQFGHSCPVPLIDAARGQRSVGQE